MPLIRLLPYGVFLQLTLMCGGRAYAVLSVTVRIGRDSPPYVTRTICGVPLQLCVELGEPEGKQEEEARGKSKKGSFIDGGWWVCYDGCGCVRE